MNLKSVVLENHSTRRQPFLAEGKLVNSKSTERVSQLMGLSILGIKVHSTKLGLTKNMLNVFSMPLRTNELAHTSDPQQLQILLNH